MNSVFCFRSPQSSLGIYINVAAYINEINTTITETKKGEKIGGEGVVLLRFFNMGLVKISIFVQELKGDEKSSVFWIIKVWEWSCFYIQSCLRFYLTAGL